ncbi:hemerythrin domain-containing protein [Egicoccus sp. AB-alg6-2]|uniref:hemerythrin domain-containing protein n=1 Tax=Egicoccus sp. AB-alg6-2 TaxID=3242692 RepID=UPI00359D7D11
MADQDIVDLLLADHREFRELFDELARSEDDFKQELFHYLVARLASHEAAEESVVHPALRDDVPGGEDVAVEVLREEAEAEKLLHRMTKMDIPSEEFTTALAQLDRDVSAHAEHEEREEFPRLREHLDAEHRRKMGAAFVTLREHGPTRPHPNTPQAPEVRAAVGPLAGVFDRARDKAREVFGKS